MLWQPGYQPSEGATGIPEKGCAIQGLWYELDYRIYSLLLTIKLLPIAWVAPLSVSVMIRVVTKKIRKGWTTQDMPTIKHINIEYPISYGCFLMFSCIKRFCEYYVHTGVKNRTTKTLWIASLHHLEPCQSAFRQSQKIAQIAKPKRIVVMRRRVDRFLLERNPPKSSKQEFDQNDWVPYDMCLP